MQPYFDRFLQRLMSDGTYSPASLGLGNPLDEIARRISKAHETGKPAGTTASASWPASGACKR